MSGSSEHPKPRPWPARGHRLPSAAGEAARTPTACNTCRERKIKCSGNQPCKFCSKRNLQCIVPESVKRKLYPVMYVKELERKVRLQEYSSTVESPTFDQNIPALCHEGRDTGSLTNAAENNSIVEEASLSDTDAAGEADASLCAGISPIKTDTMMSSSLNFGSHIKAMSIIPGTEAYHPKLKLSKSPDNAYGLVIPLFPQSDVLYVRRWPTDEESQILLDTVINSVGRVQHLFDPRSFSDRLTMEYTQSKFRANSQDLWYIQVLMVFAVGELLSGTVNEEMRFPGEQFFLEAMNSLSSLCHIHAAGTQGIEVMGLIAFYLQCADRKDDAYIYAGIALRMALLMGLHRDGGAASITRSEKTHRNRLWWTIYMQERRLAAATGVPLSIQDEAIRAAYPTDTPGFYSPEPLNTNIRTAKITGQILQTIYGKTGQTEQTFVFGVRSILSTLHQVSRDIPSEFVLDFSKKLKVTRNSATLHLMLYQAMILATRPILLHLARESLNGYSQPIHSSTPLQPLVETCIDAARRSLNILGALQQQELIANFGFFDLDAAFSVAFVFVLAETIYPKSHKHPGLHGIQGSLNIFRHLKERGNKAAANREADIRQMCDHVGISLEHITNAHQTTAGTSPVDNFPGFRVNTTSIRDLHDQQNAEGQYLMQDSLTPELLNSEHPLHWVDDLVSGQNIPDLYSVYYSDSLPITGTVETDWEALEREISRPQ